MDPGLQFVFIIVGFLTCSAGVIWAVVAILKPLVNYLVTRKLNRAKAISAAEVKLIGTMLLNDLELFHRIPNATLMLRCVGESLEARERYDVDDIFRRIASTFPNRVDATEGSAA